MANIIGYVRGFASEVAGVVTYTGVVVLTTRFWITLNASAVVGITHNMKYDDVVC